MTEYLILDLTGTPSVCDIVEGEDEPQNAAMLYLINDPRDVVADEISEGEGRPDLVVYEVKDDDLVVAGRFTVRVAC
jgi:hypothetical protein